MREKIFKKIGLQFTELRFINVFFLTRIIFIIFSCQYDVCIRIITHFFYYWKFSLWINYNNIRIELIGNRFYNFLIIILPFRWLRIRFHKFILLLFYISYYNKTVSYYCKIKKLIIAYWVSFIVENFVNIYV